MTSHRGERTMTCSAAGRALRRGCTLHTVTTLIQTQTHSASTPSAQISAPQITTSLLRTERTEHWRVTRPCWGRAEFVVIACCRSELASRPSSARPQTRRSLPSQGPNTMTSPHSDSTTPRRRPCCLVGSVHPRSRVRCGPVRAGSHSQTSEISKTYHQPICSHQGFIPRHR